MSKTMKRVSALLLAILMIVTYMPMMQETAYAAKKAKKPAKVKGLKATVKKGTKKIALSWKKAKNAKKYLVTIKDNSTKLSATKTSKKTKLTITGQWSTKYTIKVQGVNGKKKGSAAKKTVKIGANPKAASAADVKKAQDAQKKAEEDLKKAQDEYDKLKDDKDATDAQLKQAEQNLEVASEQYEKLDAQARAQLKSATSLTLDTWNDEVKSALNNMIISNKDQSNKYVVFDFDNTCSIFDVEEQLAVYQLQVMAFDESVDAEKLEDMLKTELKPKYFKQAAPASEDYCDNANATYQDWIDDITAAFAKLDAKYDFTPAGLTEAEQAEIQATDDWKEFATKMRAMYDCVFDSESAAVAYPWVLYWFTGMTHEEVYELAKASHTKYKNVASTYETWKTEGKGSKIGAVEYEWTSGTQVSQNIVELMAALHNNGIKVWICSASATDPIRAAIDVFGLHDVVDGMLAMTNVYKNNAFVNEYDYETGYAWIPTPGNATNAGWTEDTANATEAQTQGKGKVTAIQNVCGAKYNAGPIAGFMDSTGDYNFCTEFEDLEVVCCFNRASRKVTDGGGVIAELAVYQADTLHYNYTIAKSHSDTLYVLQGREENGFRDLRPERMTLRLGKSSPKLFRDDDNTNTTQLQYMIDNNMTTEEVVNEFARKKAKSASTNKLGFKYGFLKKYSGYHSQGASPKAPVSKLEHIDWSTEVKDALNDMIANNDDPTAYAVFDFDNTCSIFDVEEQLAVYQLQTMAFDESVDAAKLEDILKTELKKEYFTKPAKASADYCGNPDATYQDWIDDITAAFAELDKDYNFTPAGLTDAQQAEIQAKPEWKEFATKMRAMYDCVFDSESAAVAYPWVLYWFTGMTEEEVYQLATRSHSYYKTVDTDRIKWETPYDADKSTYDDDGVAISFDKDTAQTKIGHVSFKWMHGTQVSDNIVELWKTLSENGIDVWICSASATDPIRAAIDVWGGHQYITGMMAMTNKLDENGEYINEYDWEGGNAWLTTTGSENHGWKKDTALQKTQTQGKGKVIAIQNVLYPKYHDHGPIAGFMDSTGDYNFCTEFNTLEVVCCFNRADRKETDGGGVIAETAVYQADTLGYDYTKANRAGDTLYVLQGRDERALRKLNPGRATYVFKQLTDEQGGLHVFGSEYGRGHNEAQLACMVQNKLDTETIVNDFAIKQSADTNPYKLPFKYGFVYGTNSSDGLGPKFHDDKYNPDDLDFSGYHSQE